MTAATLLSVLAGGAAPDVARPRTMGEGGTLFGAALATAIAGATADDAASRMPAIDVAGDGAAAPAANTAPVLDDAPVAAAAWGEASAPGSAFVTTGPLVAEPDPETRAEADPSEAAAAPGSSPLSAPPAPAPGETEPTGRGVAESRVPRDGAAPDTAAPMHPDASRDRQSVASVVSVVPAAPGESDARRPTGPAAPAQTVGAAAPGPTPLPSTAPATTSSAPTAAAPAPAPSAPPLERVEPGTVAPPSHTAIVAGPPVAASVASAAPPPAPDVAPGTARMIAAQVSPVVVSIAQRPSGTHQVTLTVSPERIGPVTVRAHIGSGGEVRVELIGATDAGRDALRTIVADLRRDLAAAMPYASLSLASGSSDAGPQHSGTQPGSGERSGDQAGAASRNPAGDAPPRAPRATAHGAAPNAAAPAGRGAAGLDIFA